MTTSASPPISSTTRRLSLTPSPSPALPSAPGTTGYSSAWRLTNWGRQLEPAGRGGRWSPAIPGSRCGRFRWSSEPAYTCSRAAVCTWTDPWFIPACRGAYLLVLGILVDLPVLELELVLHVQQLVCLVSKWLIVLIAIAQPFESDCRTPTWGDNREDCWSAAGSPQPGAAQPRRGALWGPPIAPGCGEWSIAWPTTTATQWVLPRGRWGSLRSCWSHKMRN